MLWKDCLLSSFDKDAKNTFENPHLSSNALKSSEKKKELLRKWRLSVDSKTYHSTVIELPQRDNQTDWKNVLLFHQR